MRLPVPFGRRRRERELDEEIRSHFRMAVEERVARGESREQAERAVRREFGNEARVREVTRTMWGGLWLDRLVQDVGYGLRSLRRDAGFASVGVLTIGLGIGVTTAMFTVVDGAILRPLPFHEPDRLVSVTVRSPDNASSVGLADTHIVDLRDDPAPFSGAVAHSFFPPVTLTGAGDPERLRTAYVTAGMHDVLGVRPALGPGFAPGADALEAASVAVLGDRLWRERFGADPDVIGRPVTLDGGRVTVVGVMPRGFAFPDRADVWLPLRVAVDPHTSFRYAVVARLADAVTTEQARALLEARMRDEEGRALVAALTPLKDFVVAGSRYPLLLLTGAVVLVLLIACTNVANLLFMRSHRRDREIGVRKALGAGRGRLVRQLLTESLLLAGLGGTVGLIMAAFAVEVLLALAPPGTIPRVDEIGVDPTSLLFVLATSGLTAILFGTAPAFRAARKEPRDVIVRGARAYSRREDVARRALVVGEVAVAVVLLTGAGLLARTFQELRAIDLGFEPSSAVTFELDLPADAYASGREMLALHLDVVEELRRIGGVTAAGAANFEPLGAFASSGTYTVESPAEGVSGACERCAGMSIATSGYFASMGIAVLSGREFTPAEDRAGSPVVMVGRSMARRFWPGLDPVGRRIARGRRPGPEDWLTIVGVVEDVVGTDIREPKDPMVYLPMTAIDDAFFLGHARYVVRTPLPPGSLATAMRRTVATADPGLATGAVSSLDEVVVASVGDHLFEARIMSAFALLALLLTAVGIYAVTAYSVQERRREIGIRRAVGAPANALGRLVLGRVAMLVAPGLLLGGVGGVAVGRLIESTLYGVTPSDPATLVGVSALLGFVAMAAAAMPLRNAVRVSPAEVVCE